MALGKKKAEEQGEGSAEDNGGSKKKPLMFIILAVAAILVFTCTLAFGKKISAKDNGGKKQVVVEKGTIIPLDEFLVNLTDAGSDHFLKVTVALEFTKASGKSGESFKEDAPRVRDAVLAVLTNKSRADVSTDLGREKMKAEIKDSVNEALGDKEVLNVYYVNLVTQ